MEWQRRGLEARWIRVALLREAIRGVAAQMDVGADGGHWSSAGAARKRVDAWRSGCNRRSGLVGGHLMRVMAATSSDGIKGVQEGTNEKELRNEERRSE